MGTVWWRIGAPSQTADSELKTRMGVCGGHDEKKKRRKAKQKDRRQQ